MVSVLGATGYIRFEAALGPFGPGLLTRLTPNHLIYNKECTSPSFALPDKGQVSGRHGVEQRSINCLEQRTLHKYLIADLVITSHGACDAGFFFFLSGLEARKTLSVASTVLMQQQLFGEAGPSEL